MTRVHYIILAALAAYCLASCTTAQKDALAKRGDALLNRVLDVAEARALKEIGGFKK